MSKGLQVLVRDLASGTTTLVSSDSGGVPADSSSGQPAISADGRYVAFVSAASNLVGSNSDWGMGVFVKDRHTGAVERVNPAGVDEHDTAGFLTPALSAEGRYVAFARQYFVPGGDPDGSSEILVRDRQTGAILHPSADATGLEGNAPSGYPTLSADGRFVAFHSQASNLVSDDTNGASDVFIRNLQTGTITRVSTDREGREVFGDSILPTISADGRYVAFQGAANGLVPDDMNDLTDVFVKDLQTGNVTRVSTAGDGSQADDHSYQPAISGDGRYVAFYSAASNLVAGDTNLQLDVFVKNLQTGTTTRVSTDSQGREAETHCFLASISADGRVVAFGSLAGNLVSDDNNEAGDIFAKDTLTGTTHVVSQRDLAVRDPVAANEDSDSTRFALNRDGRYVAFTSRASNLIVGDTNVDEDIFVKDLQTGTIRRISTDGSDGQADGDSSGATIDAAAVSWPSSVRRPIWCRTTRTARATSSSKIVKRARSLA